MGTLYKSKGVSHLGVRVIEVFWEGHRHIGHQRLLLHGPPPPQPACLPATTPHI